MGSFLFKWAHPASEVFVTGTFDDWGRTQKLDKKDGIFQKVVELPVATEKIYYKFVVDENWTTDHTAPTEKDDGGNVNNVLLPEHIVKTGTNTVGGATSDLPGAWIETPAPTSENQAFSINPIPATAGIGNPVSLKAGEKVPDPSTLTSNTVQSTATTSKADFEKTASGAPVLPNPITPQAEKGTGMFGLPEQTKNMIPESSLPIGTGAATEAEKDPGVMIQGGGGAPTTASLAGAVPREPRREAETVQGGAASLATTSTGGGATTSALAGQVPLEPRGTATDVNSSAFGLGGLGASGGDMAASIVPETVQESQEKAGAAPEASANPEAVLEKSAVEQELSKTVSKEPATSGETSVGGQVAAIAGGVAAGATAAVAAAAAYATKAKESVQSGEAQESAKATAGQAQDAAIKAKDGAAGYAAQAQETAAPYIASAKDTATSAATTASAAAASTAASAKSALPESVQKSIDQSGLAPSLTGATAGTGDAPAAPQVPPIIKNSLTTAHEPAEAAVNPTAVSNKAAVERELHNTVLPEQGIDEPAGSGVPPTVTSSIAAAHVSPEATTSGVAVQEKAEVERELLASVKPAQSSGAPAPTLAAATSATAPDALVVGKSTETPLTAASATGGKTTTQPLSSSLNAPGTSATTTTLANPKPAVSREVSPMTRTEDQTQPITTTGVSTGPSASTSGPGLAASGASAATAGGSVPPGVTGASATKTAGVQNPALAAAQQAAAHPTQVAPGSPASIGTADSTTSKGSKRRSLFGRIKEKLAHKKSDGKIEEGSSSKQ